MCSFLLFDLLFNALRGAPPTFDGAIDTTNATGELVFNIFSSMPYFEPRLTQERTDAGLKAARARGRRVGRSKVDIE